MLVEVVREGLGPRRVDVEQDQPLDALGEQRMGHCRAGAARAHLHHALARRAGQAAPKALGEAQAVGVVADAPAIAQHHGVHRADAACLGGEVIEQWDDRLLAGKVTFSPVKPRSLAAASRNSRSSADLPSGSRSISRYR